MAKPEQIDAAMSAYMTAMVQWSTDRGGRPFTFDEYQVAQREWFSAAIDAASRTPSVRSDADPLIWSRFRNLPTASRRRVFERINPTMLPADQGDETKRDEAMLAKIRRDGLMVDFIKHIDDEEKAI